ncbi:urea carboxylase-associated protein 1 [Streptomyces sp. MA5143a]|nr:urea carboxylase-associated protein 1 [Streptomyces sp. MA5143a]
MTSVVVAARAAWSAVVPAGGTLTLTDLHGNQAVDFLVYDAHDTAVRYSAPDTIHAQGGIFLTTGSVLMSNEHTPLMTVVADDVGRHDTVGGACSKESNTLRYGHHTWSQHACVDNFLAEGARHGLGKRDLVSNVNWYMNVPVEKDGTLGIVDGISAPGLSLTLRAERDVLVLVSNCPQINNPCNGFSPTAVEMTIDQPLLEATADTTEATADPTEATTDPTETRADTTEATSPTPQPPSQGSPA